MLQRLWRLLTLGIGGLLGSAIAFWGLGKMLTGVWQQQTFAIESPLLLWIHEQANPILDGVMLSVTQLGNKEVLIVVAIATISILWWRSYRQSASTFLIACLGTFILSDGLKIVVARVRPELWDTLITEPSFSFPSGHALKSTVLYGMIAYLLAIRYPQQAKWIYTGVTIMVASICCSRLYLGVHWPTDVIIGCTIGWVWLTICITIDKWQNENGKLTNNQ